jgi:hypothetical protein
MANNTAAVKAWIIARMVFNKSRDSLNPMVCLGSAEGRQVFVKFE